MYRKLKVLKNRRISQKFGGKVILVGNYDKKLFSKLDLILEGKTLKGAWTHEISFKNKFKKLENIIKN